MDDPASHSILRSTTKDEKASQDKQEWTPEYLDKLARGTYFPRQVVCDAHNTALAAERDYRHKLAIELCKEQKAHIDELAAERELVQWCEVHVPTRDEPIKCCPCCEAVHEREQVDELREKHEAQLAAERERYADLERSILDLSHPNYKQLLADLAAVQKQRDDFRCALEQRIGDADNALIAEREHMERMLEHAKRILRSSWRGAK